MRLLDLFCGAGGAAMGYSQAGFTEIVGVDIAPQPNYPFEFWQMDALKYVQATNLSAYFDLIHASPPCQAFTSMRSMANARDHDDLLTPTRSLLQWRQVPYVIENVPGAPIDVRPVDLFGEGGGVELCGSMFGLRTDDFEVRRHRWFEAPFSLPQPECRHSTRTVVGFYGDHARIRRRVEGFKDRGTDILGEDKMRLVNDLMGIDWMSWPEANQAIPPAYTKFIGEAFLNQHAETKR